MPNFQQVHEAELQELAAKKSHFEPRSEGAVKFIDKLQDPALPKTAAPPVATVGLTLSGGGIRSATFNLGVLQGLAKFKMLSKIDFLSTVSGGGYIGAWLITWINRTSTINVEEKLGDYHAHPDPGGPVTEPEEVNFLRDYSNYLTPRKGIFGADTWAGIATYARNVFLNQLILIAFLDGVLLVPWAAVRFVTFISQHSQPIAITLTAVAGIFAILLAIFFASWHVARCSSTDKAASPYTKQTYVLCSVVLPLFIGAVFILPFIFTAGPNYKFSRWGITLQGVSFWVVFTGFVYLVGHGAGLLPRIRINSSLPPERKLSVRAWFGIPLSAAIGGGAGGLLILLLTRLIDHWRVDDPAVWYAASFGPPLIILIFLVIGALHIGLLKLLIAPEEQEWWARLGGWLLIWSIAWAGLFALAIFVPLGKVVLAVWIKTKIALIAGWVLTTVAGVLSGRSTKTNGQASGGNPKIERLASITPYVFVAGLLVLLSLGAHELASHSAIRSFCAAGGAHWHNITCRASGITNVAVLPGVQTNTSNQDVARYWANAQNFSLCWLSICCAGLFLIALSLAFRIDINVFSMNLLYRNRIVRCYLGATGPEENRHAIPSPGSILTTISYLRIFLPPLCRLRANTNTTARIPFFAPR